MKDFIKQRLTQGVGYVYGLRDPRNHEYFYVGVTVYPAMRLESHRKAKNATSEALRRRLRELENAGHEVEMVLLEKASFDNLLMRENYHMDRLRNSGEMLLNVVRNTGDNPYGGTLTDEKFNAVIKELEAGAKPRELGRKYGVSSILICQLRKELQDDKEESYIDERRGVDA